MSVTQNLEDYIAIVEQINNLTIALCQVDGKDFRLQQFIKNAGIKDYARAAYSACKLNCLYIEMFTKNLYTRDYTSFIIDCVARDHVRARDFWLNSTQERIVDDLYGSGAVVKEIDVYDDYVKFLKEGMNVGTVRIVTGKYPNGKDKKHSIISFSDPATKSPVISDTGRRGTQVDAKKFIDKDNFSYFTHIEKRS